MEVTVKPIGMVHSCYKERFGIPRQAGMVPSARAELELFPPYDNEDCIRGLQGFSHIWLIFLFHASMEKAWKTTVRPPRLGGNQRIGVFASRSPFRPNPLGLSVVKLHNIAREQGKLILSISGIDLLDETPVIDIKPYLPYADSVADANPGYANRSCHQLSVIFSENALEYCQSQEAQGYVGLSNIIKETLRWDPRPAYKISITDQSEYGMKIWDFDIKWKLDKDRILITAITS